MNLHKGQQEIVRDKHRFRVVNAGRRFGKTVLAVEELFFNAVIKEANVAYIAPTYLQARDIAWSLLKKRVQDFGDFSVNESRLEMTITNKAGTKSKITLKGWESIDSLRGLSFDFLILDEVAMYKNFNENWQEVIRPTLTDRKGGVLFISTPRGFNFWYDLCGIETKDKDYKTFHYTSYDNPFLPVDELDKTKRELTEDRFAQEIMADFRKMEGLVYKEFNRDLHLFTSDINPEGKEYIAGIDFGFTNPCAVVHVLVDNDSNFWITDEWYKTQRTEEQIGEYVKGCAFNYVYPDPESPSAINILNNKGINIVEVIKGKDSIKSGINVVRALFKANRLKIHSRCINLIQELETYSYPEKKTNTNEPENPIKENDHALDALRYVLSSYEGSSEKSAVEKYMMIQAQRARGTNFAR